MRTPKAPLSGLVDLEVFSVESDSTQLLIRSAAKAVRVHVDDRIVDAEVIGGVAVVDVDSLEPDRTYSADAETNDGTRLGTVTLRTRPTIGPILTRFATISDAHLGLNQFGVGRKLTDDHFTPYAVRCARAAIDEATDWGAELLIIKGDLTEAGQRSDWKLAEELLSSTSLPVLFTTGNHDVTKRSEVSAPDAAKSLGLEHEAVQCRDVSGLRIVVADTSRAGRGSGDLAQHAAELVDAVDSELPAFVAFHHNIQRTPIAWFWPPGISSTNAMPVVSAISEANARLFLSSGHTHRNRLHWLGKSQSIPYTEVSSTSDYPGVWAGYEVSASTIRQTIRRIAAPEAIEWTERTRSVLGGIWPRWSQGRLHDRCVDVDIGVR